MVRWSDIETAHPSEVATAAQARAIIQTFADDFTNIGHGVTVHGFMCARFELPVLATQSAVEDAIKQRLGAISQLRLSFRSHLEEDESLRKLFHRGCDAFLFGTRALQYEVMARQRLSSEYDATDAPLCTKIVFRSISNNPTDDEDDARCASDMSCFQKVLDHVLQNLYNLKYRRVGENLYREITTVDGHCTHAWELATDIRKFVQQVCSRDHNPDMWKNLTASKCNNIDEVCKYIKNCVDMECPELKPNRHIIAFRNGLYYTDQDMVYYYDDRANWSRRATDAIQNREENPIRVGECTLPSFNNSRAFATPTPPKRSDVAMKFHDVLLPQTVPENPIDISTPEVQTILTSQHLDEATCAWLYAFLGRCLHEVGDNGKDNWQCIGKLSPAFKKRAALESAALQTRSCFSSHPSCQIAQDERAIAYYD